MLYQPNCGAFAAVDQEGLTCREYATIHIAASIEGGLTAAGILWTPDNVAARAVQVADAIARALNVPAPREPLPAVADADGGD